MHLTFIKICDVLVVSVELAVYPCLVDRVARLTGLISE